MYVEKKYANVMNKLILRERKKKKKDEKELMGKK